MLKRISGFVLVARKDSEYWFIDSVFKYDDDLAGCTGMTVQPVTEKVVEDLLSIDNLVEALDAVCDDKIEYADCFGYGRIFGQLSLDDFDDFDEVYNRKALVACLAFEDGAVSYDYAVRVIFGV